MSENIIKSCNSNRVFVLDSDCKPQTPTTARRARLLMKEGKAKLYRLYPATIILDRVITTTTSPKISLKLDPGSKTTGIAIVLNDMVIWAAELKHRGHLIKKALTSRASLRRVRRKRKTRYRPARWANRANSRRKGRFMPSVLSRVYNIKTWSDKIIKFCPITDIQIETTRFDTQKMDNPNITGVEYQQGTLAGYDVREYLLEKFNRECVYCNAKNVPLEVEHLQARTKGGTDRISNLALACRPCNQKKGNKPLEEFVKNKNKLKAIKAKMKQSLKDAAVMNGLRFKIGEELKKLNLPISFWSGSRTKMNRCKNHYPKLHWIDAACVGEDGAKVRLDPNQQYLEITAKGHGSRGMNQQDERGFHKINAKTGLIKAPRTTQVGGYKTGDYVKARIKILGSKKRKIVSGQLSGIAVSGGFRISGNFVEQLKKAGIIKKTKAKDKDVAIKFIVKTMQKKDGYSCKTVKPEIIHVFRDTAEVKTIEPIIKTIEPIIKTIEPIIKIAQTTKITEIAKPQQMLFF